ncbi:hypothetical protein OV450_2529 [Actinobacteria bacterium OV450]|nr:hypothetical protein OV450_2529 [Actinobacteria bacterium OV450]
MRLVAADQHTHLLELIDAAPVRPVGGERCVHVGQHDRGDAHAKGFAENAERKVVGEARSPLVDRVKGGRRDRDGIGPRVRPRASPGVRQADLTGYPVCFSTVRMSMGKWFEGDGRLPDPTVWPRSPHKPLDRWNVLLFDAEGTCVSGPVGQVHHDPQTGLRRL